MAHQEDTALTAVLAVLPHAVTASRLAAGVAALAAASNGSSRTAATLITLGAVTDGLDGPLARRLGVVGPSGALFDYFADFVCYVVAPWGLAHALVPAVPQALLGLSLLTAAVRYSRNGAAVIDSTAEVEDLPGLGTVFVGFLPVTAVFLDAPALLGGRALGVVLTLLTLVFSLLMITPIRYPKLPMSGGVRGGVLVLLVLMPFVATRAIAAATLGLGLLYVVAVPLAGSFRRE